MTVEKIMNKADFQRYLNGCERRLNDLNKSLQTIEKSSQEQLIDFHQLNQILSEIKFLYSSILTLDQCSFASHGKKRLNFLKENLEKNRIQFEQIQHHAQMKFGYEYEENQFEPSNNEQLIKLIDQNSRNEQIELDRLHQHTTIINHLEKDFNDLHGTFLDLNRIIHEQGTMVNNIEQALTNTDEMIQEATDKVQTTVRIKKRTNRLKWIFIAVSICFVLLLIFIIYFTLKLASPYG
jgi:t-SNARE complex subunit (syntaxin)